MVSIAVASISCVCDESYCVIADNIMVTLLSEELHTEATDIANRVGTTLLTTGGTDSAKNRRLLANSVEELGTSEMGDVMGDFELSPSTSCFGMDNSKQSKHTSQVQVIDCLKLPFWDSLTVEMSQCLEKRRVGKGGQATTTESWESRGDRGVRNRLPYKCSRQPRLVCYVLPSDQCLPSAKVY